MMNNEPTITEKSQKKNISDRKLATVSSASFDTLIEALLQKSEKAQCTFVYRYLSQVPGEVLAIMNKYSTNEIKKRAKASIAKK